MTVSTIEQAIESVTKEVIEWRRYLHQHPELSFQEEKTSQFVFDKLQSFGNLEVTRPTKYSVMARLIGDQPGKTLGIRADMDALPILEENQSGYTSKTPGVMHACGHDGHTAMLLGAAKVLSTMKNEIKGEVRFFFQHAEEYFPGGAKEMVEAGVMDGVDMVIAAHLMSDLNVGKVGIGYGPMMAAPDGFWITIKGKGGHGAMPHQAIDSIAIGAQVVTNLQHIVARNVDPTDNVVLSIGKFVGGEAANVIANTVEMNGTVRSFDVKFRKMIPELMERVLKGITEAHGATYEFTYECGYLPVINDEEVTKLVEETVRDVYGEETVEIQKPKMGAEDFSAFQQKAPGSYFLIGARNEDKGIIYPHHHPRFDIDEDSLQYGVKIFVQAVKKILM
ncbi:M20 family metallopeptidase [Halalkalibacter krulwichiae]|uniref:N-acyl-L-amino acid amidohydrolase n=1 Tax=Halalkalibacter krulwichiae TaxID=199441 RepID=A0A1X9MH58_9BACI|nr:M20 family metallopeptidase [Halalkalibacter krulwichiae]ARK31840.1 N-acyl-L-amino acid amidohydrolase [Halalkalibacter krulwichiae]